MFTWLGNFLDWLGRFIQRNPWPITALVIALLLSFFPLLPATDRFLTWLGKFVSTSPWVAIALFMILLLLLLPWARFTMKDALRSFGVKKLKFSGAEVEFDREDKQTDPYVDALSALAALLGITIGVMRIAGVIRDHNVDEIFRMADQIAAETGPAGANILLAARSSANVPQATFK